MKQTPILRQAIDFTCGSISGVANCLSGYVFDTVKVRMQNDPTITMWGSLKTSIAQEGFLSLFNGIYYPMLTVPGVNAVIFGSYQFYKRIMGKKQLTFLDGVQSGAFAGLVNTAIVSPVQLIKCIMQTDKNHKFKNSRECLKFIIKTQGIRGIFRGSVITGLRQIPAYAGQFAAYEFLKGKILSQNHNHLSFFQGIFVGSIAGICCWLSSYPQDVIKTHIQLAQNGQYQRHKTIPDGGIISCAKDIYAKKGWKGFWRGIQPCLWRAFIANAFGIAVYQKMQFYIHSYDQKQ